MHLNITLNKSVYESDILTIGKLTSSFGETWNRHVLNRQPYDEDTTERVYCFTDNISLPHNKYELCDADSWKEMVDEVHREMLDYKPPGKPHNSLGILTSAEHSTSSVTQSGA